MNTVKRSIAPLAALAVVSVAVPAPVSSASGGRSNIVKTATVAALEHSRAKLRAVLLHHVVKGKITAAQLVKRHSVKTLHGQSLAVRVKHGVVTVGGVKVIKANIAASNGVIHVINGVLIPR